MITEIELIERLTHELNLYKQSNHPDQIPYFAKLDQLEELLNLSYAKTEILNLFIQMVNQNFLGTEYFITSVANLKDELAEKYREFLRFKEQIFQDGKLVDITQDLRGKLFSNYEKMLAEAIDEYVKLIGITPDKEQLLKKLETHLKENQLAFEEAVQQKTIVNDEMYQNVNPQIQKCQITLEKTLQTQLSQACAKGDRETVFLLLKYNAHPLLIDESDIHPLNYAIKNQHTALVHELLDYITHFNKNIYQSDNNEAIPLSVSSKSNREDNEKYSKTYQYVKDEFYYPNPKRSSPLKTIFSLDNATISKLMYQKQGGFFADTYIDKAQLEQDAKEIYSLHKDAARGFEHPSGNPYNLLGLSDINDPILHEEVRDNFDQVTDSPLVRRFLDAYLHQSGFLYIGYDAVERVLNTLVKLSICFHKKQTVRLKKSSNGGSLVQDVIEIYGLNNLDVFGDPNPGDIFYQCGEDEEPQFVIISEYLLSEGPNNTGCIRVHKCDIAITKSANPKVLEKLLSVQKFLEENDLFEAILKNPKLQFDAWPSLTDEQFKILIIHSPQLEYLNLSGCDQLSANIFEFLAKAECCKTLKTLMLRNILTLTSFFDNNNAVIEFAKLTGLRLSGCGNLRQISIKAPNLINLNLRDCNAFNFKISQLNCPKLESLVLSNMSQITDKDVFKLILNYPRLQRIELENCERISNVVYQITNAENGIDYFIDHCEVVATTWPKESQQLFLELVLFIYRSKTRKLPKGLTPLHIAARVGWHDFIKWLLEQDVPLETINEEGKTVLDEAVENGHEETIRELICAGASICQDTKKAVTIFETYIEKACIKDTPIFSHAQRMALFLLPIYQQASPTGRRLAEEMSDQYLLTSIRGLCLSEKANAEPPNLSGLKVILQLPGSSTLLFLQEKVIEQLIVTDSKHKRFGHLREEQNEARKKLGILSNHTVAGVEFNGYFLHFKEKPTHPLMDYAVHLLRMRLIGHGSPANILGKITVICNGKFMSYPVLISLTVPGKNFSQVLQDNNRQPYINRKIFSDLMLFDVTASPGDGSGSNYIDQESQEGDILNSIDEDQYFIEPVIKLMRGQRIDSKSILRCLPQAKDAAALESMQNWTALSMKALQYEYWQDVDKYQQDCAALFDEAEVKQLNATDKNNLFTPHLLIREGVIAQLLLNAIFIQGQLRAAMLENKPISLMELQTRINFPLGVEHLRALDDITLAPQQRLMNVTGKSLPSLTSRQSLEACLKEIPTEAELSKPKKFNLKNALTELELLKNVLLDNKILIHNEKNSTNDLIIRANFEGIKDSSKHRLLLQILVGFSYTKLEITHSEILDDNLLEAILSQSQQLTYLDVRYCPKITSASVRFIARHCPKLEILYLSGTGIQELADQPTELFANQYTAKLTARTLEFPNLKELRVAHCDQLLFIDIDTPKLQSLKTKGCKELKSAVLQAPQLKRLEIISCRQLDKLITNSSKLLTLNLTGCAKFPEESLAKITQESIHLQQFKLVDCENICFSYRVFWEKYPFLLALPYLHTAAPKWLTELSQMLDGLAQCAKYDFSNIRTIRARQIIYETLHEHLHNVCSIIIPGILREYSYLEVKDRDSKINVIKALSQLKQNNKQIVQTLLKAAKSPDIYIRSAAITALGQLGPHEPMTELIIKALCEVFERPWASEVAHASLKALAEFNDLQTIQKFFELSKDVPENSYGGSGILGASEKIIPINESVIDFLIKQLKNPNQGARLAIRALENFKCPPEKVVCAFVDKIEAEAINSSSMEAAFVLIKWGKINNSIIQILIKGLIFQLQSDKFAFYYVKYSLKILHQLQYQVDYSVVKSVMKVFDENIRQVPRGDDAKWLAEKKVELTTEALGLLGDQLGDPYRGQIILHLMNRLSEFLGITKKNIITRSYILFSQSELVRKIVEALGRLGKINIPLVYEVPYKRKTARLLIRILRFCTIECESLDTYRRSDVITIIDSILNVLKELAQEKHSEYAIPSLMEAFQNTEKEGAQGDYVSGNYTSHQAAKVLGGLVSQGCKPVIKVLSNLLEDPGLEKNPKLKIKTAIALVPSGNKLAIEIVLDSLRTSPSDPLMSIIKQVPVKYNQPSAHDIAMRITAKIVEALAEQKNPNEQIVKRLKEMLTLYYFDAVKGIVAKTLILWGRDDNSVVRALIETLSRGKSFSWGSAVESIKKLKQVESSTIHTLINFLGSSRTLPTFGSFIRSEYARSPALTLLELADKVESVFEILISRLKSELFVPLTSSLSRLDQPGLNSNICIKVGIIKILGQLGRPDKKFSDALVNVLRKYRGELRVAIIAKLGTKTGMQEWNEYSSSFPFPNMLTVRQVAIEALGQLNEIGRLKLLIISALQKNFLIFNNFFSSRNEYLAPHFFKKALNLSKDSNPKSLNKGNMTEDRSGTLLFPQSLSSNFFRPADVDSNNQKYNNSKEEEQSGDKTELEYKS